ncbi:GIY-YIG nuclease family protein [Vibrio methylphosphonaticus]|uniref:GIY-YIG nuclease family protein n=1 Tax=Vibrio methylphosphonaticus TaxID=2946866 RepID=UPI002029C3E0|nr:GIY-YIG nuclease family protein [Vibrio methylphosphonaticus]MCL9776665.1 GIY-YIG nuclease family protein [Vibrio methylphosphonaticus]
MTDLVEPWTVYLLRTNEQKLYCGITNNMERRFIQHESGKGAKALRGRGPLLLVWSQLVEGKSQALKTEFAIKKLSKAQKEKLVVNSERFLLKD